MRELNPPVDMSSTCRISPPSSPLNTPPTLVTYGDDEPYFCALTQELSPLEPHKLLRELGDMRGGSNSREGTYREGRGAGSRKAWDASSHSEEEHNSVGAAAFSVLGSAETAPAVNPGSGAVAGSGLTQELQRTVTGVPSSSGASPGGFEGSGQSCVRVVVDGNAAMDVKHFSTHTSPSHPATGATRVDFLNLQPGSKVRISCLGNAAEYGSAFLLLRHLG